MKPNTSVDLGLIRRLYEAGYSRREVVNLFKFIDWVMILPEELKQAFWLELKAYEEERKVPYITAPPISLTSIPCTRVLNAVLQAQRL